MNARERILEEADAPAGRPRPRSPSLARRAVLSRLAGLVHGEITLIEHGRTHRFGASSADCPLAATLQVHDEGFYPAVAFGGSIGAGESYMAGEWSTDDLTALVRILLRNREVLDGLEGGLARLAAPFRRLAHGLHRNTRSGSRRNIAAHYDQGNELFALFLDPSMTYSSAVFSASGMSLEDAQTEKFDRVCRKLDLSASDRLLEIGTGWGGFALHAARHYGCRVTTTTISRRQFELARQRVAGAGLGDRIELLQRDYRDLSTADLGHFDKLVSIEMIEAVGHQNFDGYFRKCSELLAPRGAMLLQAITIADRQYEQAKRSVDFIQRYIFPGSCLPSIGAIADSLARVTDLTLFDLEDIGPHYATTLRSWRERFFANIEAVRELGYPDSFIRMWEFYLCYCEGGFIERVLGDAQMLLLKPLNRRAPLTHR